MMRMLSIDFQKNLTKAIIILFVIIALLSVFAILSNALSLILQTHALILMLASIFFLFSIVIWLVSWIWLLKKKYTITFKQGIYAGFSSFFGSLTPIQLGADFLKALFLKKVQGIPVSDSLSASFIVKASKFLLLMIFSLLIILLLFFETTISLVFFIGLLSGFALISIFTLFFLAPFNKKLALLLSRFLACFHKNKFIKKIHSFYLKYSENLQAISFNEFFFLLLLGFASWFFELLALLFTFIATRHALPLLSVFALFVLLALLERTPMLPRGLGLVESAGFVFLSMPYFAKKTFEVAEIAAVLIVYDFVRLIIPTIFSIILAFLFLKANPLNYSKEEKPE